MSKGICPYCKREFQASYNHPEQRVCSSAACQRRRAADYHRKKFSSDPLYRDQCRFSQKKWRDNNPGYLKIYRGRKRCKPRHHAERLRLSTELHQLADLVKSDADHSLQLFEAEYLLVCRPGHQPELLKPFPNSEFHFLCWSLAAFAPSVRDVKKGSKRPVRDWSEEDDRLLFNLAGFKSLRVIGAVLYRSRRAVLSRLTSLENVW